MTVVTGIEAVLHLALAWELGRRFGVTGILAGGAIAHVVSGTVINSAQVGSILGVNAVALHGRAFLTPLLHFGPALVLLLLQERHAPIPLDGWPGFLARAFVATTTLGAAAALLVRRKEYDVILRVAPPLARVLGIRA